MSEARVLRFKPRRIDPEELALQALNYLACDQDRLLRFLQFSGIEPAAIRQAATMPGFMLGVLDYVVAHEWLVLGLADHAEVHPQDVLTARNQLGGPCEV